MKTTALVTLLLTLCLITLGGIVHNTGSSLACPDWPLCYGSAFPKMEGGIAIEHSHRLLATLVGCFTIALVVLSARSRKRDPLLLKVSCLALALVIFQGVLGGVTVLMQLSPYVSTAHLATSQLFLAALLWINFRARDVQGDQLTQAPPAKALRGVSIALGCVYLQMLLGAAIRHGGAGVACGLGSESMFLCIDPMTASKTFWPTLGPAQLNMIHRYFGLISGAAVIAGTMPLLKWAKRLNIKPLRKLTVMGHILWTLQVILGVLTIRNYIGVVPVTLHLLVAACLWMTLLSLTYFARGVRRAA